MGVRVTVALFLVAILLAGCGGGFQTVTSNHSNNNYVLKADDDMGARYYAIAPGADVVVDDTGEANPATDAITLLAPNCVELQPVAGYFWQGGEISIEADGQITFAAGRSVPGLPRFMVGADETTNALSSCEAAAARL